MKSGLDYLLGQMILENQFNNDLSFYEIHFCLYI
ncbi:hypothetical protein Belba_3350 [Belliella baltica DSM 15883]|uniref:Uncharacterized protein n=1 Tax=Belliella baltica (strain DSM 15883 / CIP 108006 / LMG 21964 / BA134) TaxID=866536 RepID=I3Z9D6_BELBD|nr:hypothetical protein Belba_3350 [Belliella baltica DSM 15883]